MGYRLLNLRENTATDKPFRFPSTAEVAKATEIAVGTINALEKGRNTNPSIDVIERLARYYEVTPDYILGWSPFYRPDMAWKYAELDDKSANALLHLAQRGNQATLEYALMLLQSINLKEGDKPNGDD